MAKMHIPKNPSYFLINLKKEDKENMSFVTYCTYQLSHKKHLNNPYLQFMESWISLMNDDLFLCFFVCAKKNECNRNKYAKFTYCEKIKEEKFKKYYMLSKFI